MNQTPKLTIITVVLNGGEGFRQTVQSVMQQDFASLEYVVFDGGSNDGGPEWAESLNYPPLRLIRGKDNSIYDAMNQAVHYASGDWLYFLNAGDTLFDNHVISRIMSQVDENATVISGYVQTKNDPTGVSLRSGRVLSLKAFYFGIPVSHQGMMAKRELFETIGHYDLSYTIVADQEWLLRYFSSDQVHYQFLPETFAWYETVGFSHRNRRKAIAQCLLYSARYFPAYIHAINLLRYPWLVVKIQLINRLKNSWLYTRYRKLRFG